MNNPQTVSEAMTMGVVVGVLATGASFTDGASTTPTMNVRLSPKDADVLRLVQGQLGGIIYGVYKWQGREWVDYKLRGKEMFEALETLEMWLPECSKKEQFRAWRKKAQPTLSKQPIHVPKAATLRVKQHPRQVKRWDEAIAKI